MSSRPRRLGLRLLAVLMSLAVFGAACGSDNGDKESGSNTPSTAIQPGKTGGDENQDVEASYGGKIVVGVETETDEWDPKSGTFTAPGAMIALSFYDPLIALDPEGRFRPFLAESMEPNEDLSEWTLTLREGVQFHDGTTLDAEALKWNWDNLHFAEGVRNRGTLLNAGTTGMEIVDDLTVKYTLSGPNAAFPEYLRSYVGYPVSPTAYEADPEGFGNHPVGTGPFEFVSWSRDDRLVVKRNENYWQTAVNGDQLPYLDGIEFRVIPDDQSRTAALSADDIQVIQTLRGPSIKKVLGMVEDGGFEASLYAGNQSSNSLLNTLSPPLDDLRIRQALAYVNDRDAIAKVRDDDGLVPLANGFFSEDSPWFSAEAVADYPGASELNPERATELVEEYRADPDRSDGKAPGDPINIVYQCQPDPSLMQTAQLLQNQWQGIGIDLELIQVDQATMVANVVGSADTDPPRKGTFQIACWRSSGGEGDPLLNMLAYFGPSDTTPGNVSNFTDPRIDDALVRLRESSAFSDRYEAMAEISTVVSEQVPHIWNSGTPTLIGYRKDVLGIPDWLFPDGTEGTGTPDGIARYYTAFIAK
ncbi:MAG: ABC transporter substrate-binding protein [Acidimicrobiia bacterium]